MPDFISITDKDNSRSIKVPKKALLTVALDENPTTGFSWQLQPFARDILSLVADDYVLGAKSGVGGGGVRQYQFQAMAAGTAAIRLRYRRSWDPPEKSAREFAVDIIVE